MSKRANVFLRTILNIFDFAWPFAQLEDEYRFKIPKDELDHIETRVMKNLPTRVLGQYQYALIVKRPLRSAGLGEYLHFLFLWLRGHGFVVAERFIFEVYLFRLTRLALEARPNIDLSAFQGNPLGSLPACRQAIREALGDELDVICGKLDCIARGLVQFDSNHCQDVDGLVCESLWEMLADARERREATALSVR